MTISTQASKIVCLGNAATTAFDYDFLIPAAAYAVVTYTDADGIETVLTAAQYTLSGVGDADGGTVTYPLVGSPIATGTSLTIERVLPLQQLTSIVNQGGFFPAVIEAAFDFGTMISQQLNRLIGRALIVAVSDDAPAALPPAAQRVGKYFSFDANGDPSMSAGTGNDSALRTDLAAVGGAALVGITGPSTVQAGLTARPTSAVLAASTGSSLVGHIAAGTGAVATTLQELARRCVRVLDYVPLNLRAGILARTGTTDLTSYIALALAQVPSAGGSLYFDDGEWLGTLSVRRNNIAIIGPGSAACKIKHPVVTLTNVLELGDTASGNGATAYTGITVRGVTLDGNRANVSAPGSDLVGHGLTLCKISYFHFSDVRAINCHNAGLGVFINSNYGYADAYVENCGNATHTGPGFDINSSKYGIFNIVSKDCYVGSRVLDNCFGNVVHVAVQNATRQACVYNNQTVNESYGNEIHVTAIGGCADVGMSVGENCRNSILSIAVDGITGYGYHSTGANSGVAAANIPTGNKVTIASKSGQVQAALIEDNNSDFTILSYLDGRAGAAGAVYAVDVYGNNNSIDANVVDGATFQVRGLAVRAGATDNRIRDLRMTGNATIVAQYSDAGTRTLLDRGTGFGADIASVAGAITLPLLGSVFNLTGTNAVTSINNAAIHSGRTVTFITTSTAGFTNGSNLKLSGNFVGSANDTITLTCDGTNFYELPRRDLSGSATYDPANLVDGAGATTTVTVTGASLGDYADTSFSLDLQGITLTAWVSASDTVSVRFQNETGGAIDLGSGTLRARVRKT